MDLYDEHVILRRKASIHNTRFASFIPSEWRKRFENLGTTNETQATSVKSFVRQFVKHTFIRRCFLRPQNLGGSSSDIIFHSHIPKVWLKKEISRLFNSHSVTNNRAEYLRKTIKNIRNSLESSTHSAKNLPYARNVIDLKVNLGCRTKLLDWFVSRRKLPGKRVVEVTLPKLINKKVDKLLKAQEENKFLKRILTKSLNKQTAIVRSMRLHGGNTGKWSAEALQHVFWYECMVGKWDSDLSKDHLIEALKVIVTNANNLIT